MEWLKKFDSLSMEAKLYSGTSNSRLQTNFGAFISILSYITILASIIYFFYSFLQYDKPFIVQNDIIEDQPVWPNFNQIPFMVRLSDDKSVPYIAPESIYSVSGLWITTQETNGSLAQIYENISFKRCNLSDTMSYANLFQSMGSMDSFFCPIFNRNVNMTGYYGGVQAYSYFIVFMRQCNTKNSSAGCLPQADIDNFLDHSISYVDFMTVDNYPSQYNPDPKTSAIYTLRESASNSLQARLWLGLHHVDYFTDMGFIFEDLQVTNFHMIEYYKQTLTLASIDKLKSGGTSMILLSMYNHKVKTVYHRSYKKFQELLAQLGGIVKAISVISEFLFFSYGRNSVFLKLINSIIHITKTPQFFDFKAKVDLLEVSTSKINNFMSNNSKFEINKSFTIRAKNHELRERLKLGFINSLIPLQVNCSKNKNVRLAKTSLEYVYQNLTVDNILQTSYELGKLKLMLLTKDEQDAFNYLYSSKKVDEHKLEEVTKALRSIFEERSSLRDYLQGELRANKLSIV